VGVLIVLMSLALNSFHIAHELPEVSHPDEPKVVRRAMAMGTGDLNPHFFRYPTLWIYLVLAAQGTAATTGIVLGRVDMDDLKTLAFTNPTLFYMAGRILAAILGAGSVWLTWLVARRFLKQGVPVAALLVCFNASLVWQSHYATADGPLVFFVLICLTACLRALEPGKGTMTGIAAAAAAAGLAASVKYNGVAACGMVGTLVIILGRRDAVSVGRTSARLVAAALIAVVAFVAGSPYALLDTSSSRIGLGEVLSLAVNANEVQGTGTYLHTLLRTMGPLALLAAVTGIGLWTAFPGRRSVPSAGWILLGFLVPYVFLLQMAHAKFPRFLLPVIPFLSLGAAMAWERLHRLVRGSLSGAGGTAVLLAVLAVLVGPSVRATVRAEHRFAFESARTRAAKWIYSNLPPGTSIFLDAGAVSHLLPDRETVEARLERWRALDHPRAVTLAHAYALYLETEASSRGYRLVPTEDDLIHAFSSGHDPERDYRPERLGGIEYLVVEADTLAGARAPVRASFYRSASRWYRTVFEARDETGLDILVMKRTKT
jgi:hypothetical protein